jgi:hypothetical protein
MSHRFSRLVMCLPMLTAAMHAGAATQGTPSSTSSTGSFVFTANAPATPRLVQVLNISDVTVDNSSRALKGPSNVPGGTMSFCVVDTYVGTVGLSISSTNYTGTNGWNVRASSDGSRLEYDVLAETPSETTLGASSPSAASFAVSMGPTRVVGDSSQCSTGNIRMHLNLKATMPTSLPAKSYTDTVTIVATPQ